MKRINIAMSGGRTSAYMTEKALELQSKGHFQDVEFVITFANTGREHNSTLEFINNCDMRWQEIYGVPVVWLEAVVHHDSRIPCTHKVVDFESAARGGEPFEDVVKKYGLPNMSFLHCTRELKENPIMSYMESLGEKKGYVKNGKFISATYETWIGIRSDEPRRLGGNNDGKQFKVYPLARPIVTGPITGVDLSCDKIDVLDFWEDMAFDLDLPEHLGNCIDCHKKSEKKLFMAMRDMGENAFRFSENLDEKYSEVKAQSINGKVVPRKRFRGNLNTGELIGMFRQSEFNYKSYPDENEGCASSCEPFMMDNTPEEEVIEND